MNLYGYTNNDPVNGTDPSGRCSVGALTFAGGAALADGPVPIGDAVGAVAIAGNCIYRGVKGIINIIRGAITVANVVDGSDGTPVPVDDTGKIHGDLPEIGDIDDENLEEWDKNLKESIQNRSDENDRFPNGNPNGDDKDKRDFEKSQQHRERIAKEQKLREEIRRRLKEFDKAGKLEFQGLRKD